MRDALRLSNALQYHQFHLCTSKQHWITESILLSMIRCVLLARQYLRASKCVYAQVFVCVGEKYQ